MTETQNNTQHALPTQINKKNTWEVCTFGGYGHVGIYKPADFLVVYSAESTYPDCLSAI